MKVGDLVQLESVMNDHVDVHLEHGIVVKLSRTGHKTKSAQVLFADGTTGWYDSQMLEVVSEAR